MKATVLVDNIPHEGLEGEWGLSIYIEHNGHRYLLDTGASELFAVNAEKLGIDLAAVEYGALSHAHYDHADGMAAFFAQNDTAPFWLRRGAGENCFGGTRFFSAYIGIHRGFLERFRDRIRFADGCLPLTEDAWLLGHSTPGLEALGKKAHMYLGRGLRARPDDFSHEQSLVLKLSDGLAVFSSCSHGGVENILNEVSAAFPDTPVRALVGGFHLYLTPAAEVRALARRLKAAGVHTIVTGHCTGDKAYDILRDELGDGIRQMHTGLVLEL